ncbi:MAG: AzlD domain-containing protein [Polaromonas sp.]|nr:AzlD domain-containing protein [Polaromonas sp.]
MAVEPTFLLALLGMAVASFACRISGFLLMGYVTITPRVEAALKAIPISVMVGIVTPAATAGKLPELLGLLAVGLAMKLVRNDLAAAVAGAATVGVARWALG